LWLKLSGNQIRVQKGAESDAKVHLIGTLSRHTTSVRPIISPDLGRDTLLLEGIQIPSDEQSRLLFDDQEEIILEAQHHSIGSAAAHSHSETIRRTFTIELGFESSQEAERWLRATQDIIN
jgi:hypothetical protein